MPGTIFVRQRVEIKAGESETYNTKYRNFRNGIAQLRKYNLNNGDNKVFVDASQPGSHRGLLVTSVQLVLESYF
jgi:hypothetical protein